MTKDKPSFEIQFQPLGKRVFVQEGTSVLEAARLAGIDITSACGGEGSCGQCQVVLLAGAVNRPTQDEIFFLSESERLNGYRLACCTQVQGNIKVHIPKESVITGQRLQVESNLPSISPDPLVHAFAVELTPPDINDIRSDLTRLKDALKSHHHLEQLDASHALIQNLSPVLRSSGWKVNVFVRESEIAAVCPVSQRPFGLAVDLGTTKIAASLIDLESGEALLSSGIPNPQLSYGEDVISRLNYAVRTPEGGTALAKIIRQGIDSLLGELLDKVGAQRAQVVEACIVGNTAMTHLLLGYPVRQLASAPYVAASSDAVDIPAHILDLHIAPAAVVHIPPSIGGFVGADHVAMVLASDLHHSDRVILGLDIGTNTEISLKFPGSPNLTAVSCASGPAFEGAHIRDGMRAASGAIEKVRIVSGEVEWITIDHAPPVGLCGSGILDAVAELYKAGYLDKNSRFQRVNSRVRQGDHGPEFVLAPGSSTGSGRDVVLTQKDVNEIVLAKGAVQAGLNVLLASTGVSPDEVQEVIVAGAFGSFLNIENALTIGLFPHFPNAQYRQVGNAAALGAHWILISRQARELAQSIAQHTRYLELTTYPKFNRQFALSMLFPEL
jgi:uncharacterized 2Fe-2S/4Fe-4S cluster protein (DUF4445 family)